MILARRRQLLGWWALAAASGGCALTVPPSRVPMDLTRLPGPCSGRAPALVVMLPGAYSRPQEFVDEGFVAELRRRGLAADVVIADAHLGYFQDRSVLRRLREDLVLPARAQGYRQVWLAGISLGGFGALAYGARHGDEVDGILALAPYLGRRQLHKEIIDAGGPQRWRTQRFAREADDAERDLWEWLAQPAPAGPPVWLGYGRDDRFADAHRMLAQVLPAERRFDTPGGHDWPPWRALWSAWLDRRLLPQACAGGAA